MRTRNALLIVAIVCLYASLLLELTAAKGGKGGRGGRGGGGGGRGGRGGGGRQGNTGQLSKPSTRELKEMEELLEQWNDDGSFTRGKQKTARTHGKTRLDLQGYDSGFPFDRYNIQKGTKSFAVVHIQRDHHFPRELIRHCFMESARHQAHVFLTDTHQGNIPTPSDGKHYEHHDHDDIRVYSTAEVLHSLVI